MRLYALSIALLFVNVSAYSADALDGFCVTIDDVQEYAKAMKDPIAKALLQRVLAENAARQKNEVLLGDALSAANAKILEMSKIVDRQYLDAKFPEVLSSMWLSEWLPENFNSLRVKNLNVLAFDIDKFSFINNSFGHDQADVILKRLILETLAIAQIAVRKEDKIFFVRNGGDEFFLFLPNLSFTRAIDVAEAIRRGMEGYRSIFLGLKRLTGNIEKPYPADKDFVSLSMGITHESNIPSGKLTPEEVKDIVGKLTDQADRAIYQSKSDGRNSVTAYMGSNVFLPVQRFP